MANEGNYRGASPKGTPGTWEHYLSIEGTDDPIENFGYFREQAPDPQWAKWNYPEYLQMSPRDYGTWMYGTPATELQNGIVWRDPNQKPLPGREPIGFYEDKFDFGDMVLLGITTLSGLGLTGVLPGTTSIFSGAAAGAGGLSEAAIGEIVAAEGGYSALASSGMAGTAVGGSTLSGWDVLGSYGDMATDAGFEGGLLTSAAEGAAGEAVTGGVTGLAETAAGGAMDMGIGLGTGGPVWGFTGGEGLSAFGGGTWGWLTDLSDWAKANPLLASTATNVGGGFLKSAFAPSLEEQAKAAAKAKSEAEREILENRRRATDRRGVNVNRIMAAPQPGLLWSGR